MTRHIATHSLEQALEELERGAKVIAGGTDLMIHVRLAKLHGANPPDVLLDVTGIPELHRIDMQQDKPFVGAAVTFHQLETDETVKQVFPLLTQAAESVGSVQIRTLATIGGNVANASPGADGITALTALGAKAEIASLNGLRHAPLEELILGPNRTTLAPGELLVGFELNRMAEGSAQRFSKIGRRRAVVIARMNLALCLDRDLNDPRIVLGACFPTPRRLAEVENLLKSGDPGAELWENAGKMSAEQFSSACGWRESAIYKIPAMTKLVAGTLESVWSELGGPSVRR